MLWWKNEKMTNITTQAFTMILNESEESEVSWGKKASCVKDVK